MTQDDLGSQGFAGGADWSRFHSRLRAAEAGLARKLNPSAEERKNILRQRARGLARQTEVSTQPLESMEVVEFLLAHERYAAESRFVSQIFPLREFTPVPATPEFLLGLVNVRGRILAVIDIRRFFELPERGITDLNKVIVLRTPLMELGILADAVLGIRSVAVDGMTTTLPTLTGIRAEYLKGVTSELVAVLDAPRLLSDPRIVVNDDFEVS
jgi:purine-binding chemotaxis protein CheW